MISELKLCMHGKGLLCIRLTMHPILLDGNCQSLKLIIYEEHIKLQSTNDLQTLILTCMDINAFLLHGKPIVWSIITVLWMK